VRTFRARATRRPGDLRQHVGTDRLEGNFTADVFFDVRQCDRVFLASEADRIALGTGALDKDGKKVAFNVKVGDKVLVGKYAGTEVKLDEVIYLLLREEEILAVIE